MQQELQAAYLISSIPYRETSVIAHFFTLNSGLINLVVRGVRKPKSKIFLQPFTPLLVNFFGKTDLKTCNKLEVASEPVWLVGDALASGWYMNELIQRLIPNNLVCKNLFQHYSIFMPDLQDKSKRLMALREFELQLLKTIGIQPHFLTSDNQELEADKIYTYYAEQGFFVSKRIESDLSFYGKDLLDIKNRRWTKTSLSSCKKITNYFISPLLGNKPLQSRKLLSQKITANQV